jgi:hypothetical protein
LNPRPCPLSTEATSASAGPPRTRHCVEVEVCGPDCGPAFSSQTSLALMLRCTRLQAQISLPARLPCQAHRPRYSEGPAAPRTKRTHPPKARWPLMCWRSLAVGPGLRLGTSTAPDRFPPGPSARLPRPNPWVASAWPGTRVPGHSKSQSSSGSREYYLDPGRDSNLSVSLRIVPSPRTPSPSRAGLSSRHLAPRASRGGPGHDSDRA